LFVSTMVAEDSQMMILKMPLLSHGLRMEAFKELMWQNVLTPPAPNMGPSSGIGVGSSEGPMRLVEIGLSDGASSYTTTKGIELATRHFPLASSTTTLAGEERREDCWQAAAALYEVIMVDTLSVADANQALDLLYRLHSTGVSNEWGGTRTSGEKKVEAFKWFTLLWREICWAIHNVAQSHPVLLPVAAAARDLTAPNTQGPKVWAPGEPPAYKHQRPTEALQQTSFVGEKRTNTAMGSLWDQYCGQYNKKLQRISALPFEGVGEGPDELYDGAYIGVRGHRQ